MSSFIPIVPSSPPPMDEGGGFDWDDDDDDFGTFASADTSNSFKVENPQSTDIHQSNDSSQQAMKDEFADFTAFENKNGSFSVLTEVNSAITSNEIRPGTIPLSKYQMLKHSAEPETNQMPDSNLNGPLTDSGMFSSEISPIPLNEEQTTNNQNSEHSDSLDDIHTDSLSDNTDCKVKADPESVSDNTSPVINGNSNELSADKGHQISAKDGTPEPVIVNKDEHVSHQGENDNINDLPSARPLSQGKENDSIMCSDDETQTSIDYDDIPSTKIQHSTTDCDSKYVNEISGNKVKAEEFNEWTNSDRDLPENVSSNNVTNSVKEEDAETMLCSVIDKDNSGDLSQEINSDIPDANSCNQENVECFKEEQISVTSANVKRYINDTVISEAVRKFSETDNTSDIDENEERKDLNDQSKSETQISDLSTLHNSNSQTYQENQHTGIISNEQALNEEQPQTEEDGSGDKNDFGAFSDSVINTESEKDHAHSQENTDEFGDFSCVSQTSLITNTTATTADDAHIPQTNSLNTSPKLSCEDINSACATNGDDEFSDFSYSKNEHIPSPSIDSVVTKSETDLSSKDVNNEVIDDFGDFSVVQNKSDLTFGESTHSSSQRDASIKSDIDNNVDDFTDFDAGQIKPNSADEESKAPITEMESSNTLENDDDDDDFGDFGDFSAGPSSGETAMDSSIKDSGFANFTSPSTETAADDWAAFDEPQTAVSADNLDNEDDWGDFGGDESNNSDTQSVKTPETQHTVPAIALQNMTKHEKLVYAVASCFPDVENEGSKLNMFVDDLTDTGQPRDHPKDEYNVVYKTCDSLIQELIGHKKAPVPIFASGLTLLEPVKGSAAPMLKPDVLVDTIKIDTVVSHSQETIPPAQFDWTNSGLTNPLEANNKTLNLDFLIQDQSSKSTELESEFLGPGSSHVTKPAIQPLENILANLKTSSTFKPLDQSDDISDEAQTVVQSLPNLSFMKSRVLMFPLHMD